MNRFFRRFDVNVAVQFLLSFYIGLKIGRLRDEGSPIQTDNPRIVIGWVHKFINHEVNHTVAKFEP